MAPVTELNRQPKKIQVQEPKSTPIKKPCRCYKRLSAMLNKACDQMELLEGRRLDLQRRCDRAEAAGQRTFVVSLKIQIHTVTNMRRCYYDAAAKIAEELKAQKQEDDQD